MFRYLVTLTLFVLGGCSAEINPKTDLLNSTTHEFRKNGIFAVDFYDAKEYMHVASMSPCIETPCREHTFVVYDAKNQALINLPADPATSYEKQQLVEFGEKLRQQIPDQERMLVNIGVETSARNKNVIGVVIPLLERYALLKPDTVEVSSLPNDSVLVTASKDWKLIRNEIELRDVVSLRVQKFVRK